MKTKFFVPASFDLKAFLKANPPQQEHRYGVTYSKLAYIFDCIITKGLTHKKKPHEKGRWAYLKAEYLKDINSNYKNCIRYLINNRLIETNGYHIGGIQSIGYQIPKVHLEHGWKAIEGDYALLSKIWSRQLAVRKKDPRLEVIDKDRSALIKILKSPLLKIDVEAANDEIDKNYGRNKFIEMRSAQGRNFEPDDAIDIITQSKANFKLLINKIDSKDFVDPVADKSGYRLHSPITQLPKCLRKFLTYNGEPLVSLDLKNSQPYFSLLLLQKRFFRKKGRNFLKLGEFDGELYDLLTGSIQTENTPIMLPKVLKLISNESVTTIKNYISDVEKGIVYDRFLSPGLPEDIYQFKRDAIKEKFFEVLYGNCKMSNTYKRFYKAYELPFHIFSILKGYPEIHSPEKQNKAHESDIDSTPDHSRFSKLLQRAESHLVLDVICKQLIEAIPEIPLITVHDSIATTKNYIPYVEEVIKKVLLEATGYLPRLTEEDWANNA